jgi:hypothetical protein
VVHPDVASVVDTLLRGFPIQPELRYRDDKDEIHIEKSPAVAPTRNANLGTRRNYSNNYSDRPADIDQPATPRRRSSVQEPVYSHGIENSQSGLPKRRVLHIYAYGVARNRLEQSGHRLGIPLQVAKTIDEADVVMTLRTYYRSRQEPIVDAEARGIPIYVLRANTINQMEQSLAEIFNLPQDSPAADLEEISSQTQSAIQAVMNGQRWVDLPPASSNIRRIQHEMAKEAQLVSQSYGREPNRRVRIFRE